MNELMPNEVEDLNVLRDLDDIAFVQIVLIIFGAIFIYYVVQKLVPRIAEKIPGRGRLYLLATVPVIRLLVIIIAISMIIVRIIQPTVQNVFTILGAFALALGFAFKDYASSLIAGVVLLYEMPYRPGDWIKIEGTYGEVMSIGIRAMEIVTPEDNVVTIPHLKLWDKQVWNANDGKADLMCVTDFYLEPDHNPKSVTQILRNVTLSSCFLQLKKPVQVVINEEPWGTHYKIKAYPVEPRDQFRFTTDLTVCGKKALRKRGFRFVDLPVIEGISH